jgi:hypothetical protein
MMPARKCADPRIAGNRLGNRFDTMIVLRSRKEEAGIAALLKLSPALLPRHVGIRGRPATLMPVELPVHS